MLHQQMVQLQLRELTNTLRFGESFHLDSILEQIHQSSLSRLTSSMQSQSNGQSKKIYKSIGLITFTRWQLALISEQFERNYCRSSCLHYMKTLNFKDSSFMLPDLHKIVAGLIQRIDQGKHTFPEQFEQCSLHIYAHSKELQESQQKSTIEEQYIRQKKPEDDHSTSENISKQRLLMDVEARDEGIQNQVINVEDIDQSSVNTISYIGCQYS